MNLRHVVVMRHGHTELSESGVYASTSDVPLNERGRAGASAWAPHLNGLHGHHSPLVRAAETASLAQLQSAAEDQLTEWNLGELEGQVSEQYRLDHPDWSLFRHGAPGGESPAAVIARADDLIGRLSGGDQDVVVLVSHGQFSKVLATRLLGLDLTACVRMMWGPGRLAVFSWRDSAGGFCLAGWNRTPAPLTELISGNA